MKPTRISLSNLMLRTSQIKFACLVGSFFLCSLTDLQAQSVIKGELENPVSVERRFLDGLWSRGYYDLASEYLASLKSQKKLDATEIAWLDARSSYEEASAQIDLNRRRAILEQAIAKMAKAIQSISDPVKADDARLIQIRAVIELAHLLWIDAQDQPTPSQSDVATKQARLRYEEARKFNATLLASLNTREKSFKLPVLPDDPRRNDFERTQLDRLNAELQVALIDYEEAQTWPEKSSERSQKLVRASEVLQKLHETNRGQVAGQNARLWQAKCLQELGKLPEASGIYGELIDQADPALRDLKRRAMYFRILAYRDRGDFALAADECRRWLDAYPDQARTDDGLGVQLELAKNIIFQLPKLAPNEKAVGERIARERLGSVVRVYSKHQAEARKMLTQLRKTQPDVNPERLDFNSALAAGQEAMELKDWTRAHLCFEAASKKAIAAKDTNNYVKSRYFEAVSLFRADRYYEAYVLGDYLSKRYPSVPLSANAAEIGLASMTYAYNVFKNQDPVSDLNRIIAMAEYIAKIWPESPQADTARITLGEVFRGQGRYDEALKPLLAVPKNSEQYAEAQSKLGLVYWRKSQSNGQIADTKLADQAIAALQESLKTQKTQGVPANNLKLISTQLDLADILTLTGRSVEAIELLNEVQNNSAESDTEVKSRLQRLKVGALIAADQLDQALADLAIAEKNKLSLDELSSLYFQLGQALQDEMQALKSAKDGRFVKVRQSYQSFLKALASSKAGESWQALQWVAEAQLEDSQNAEALATLQRITKQYLENESFISDPSNAQRTLRTQMKLAEAARKARQFSLANSAIKSLESKNPNLLPMLMEKGRLLEAEGKSSESFLYWRNLTTRLGKSKPRPNEYYEAWLELAGILEKQGKASTAKQSLISVLRLSGSTIPSEWKSRMDSEIKRLSTLANQKTGTRK